MNKNKFRNLREQLGYTQADLADKTDLSIRTIQRVESGKTIPKGHTLKVLATALDVKISDLQSDKNPSTSLHQVSQLKWINLAGFCFIGIPFGNVIIPLWLWNKYRKSALVDEVGKKIISFQIIWTIITCLSLIISPFLQDLFPQDFTLILNVALVAMVVNIFFIVKTAIALHRNEFDLIPENLVIF